MLTVMLWNCWGFNRAAEGIRNIQVNESEDFLFKGIRLAGFGKQISPPSHQVRITPHL